MFCVNCGVRLADTETRCPLCDTVVYHPDIKQPTVRPLYPTDRTPKPKPPSKGLNGAILILFFIPVLVSLLSDWQTGGTFSWFGFVAGALVLAYITIGLPLWFSKPNPVIFVPCDVVVLCVYLFYVNQKTDGNWFFSFALPVTLGFGIVVCAVITLLRYVKGGRLYIWGGALMAVGALMLMVEWLLDLTFNVNFIGWSIYPLIVLMLLGGTLIYLALNRTARETMERKLFF